MSSKNFGTEISTIGPTGDPTYRFIDHDDDKIRLVNLKDSSQFIFIEKQSLLVFADVFSKLGNKFTV